MKFEYGDLYRFIVSAGIALITLSLLTAWGFLSTPIDTLLSDVILNAPGIEAKELISVRRYYVGTAIRVVPYTSGILFILGLTLIFLDYSNGRQFKTLTMRKNKFL